MRMVLDCLLERSLSLFERDFQGACLPGLVAGALVVGALVAVASQHLDDLRRFRDGEHVGAAEVSLPLARQPHLQMARAGATMLHLASGGDTETLLDALMGLLLWHDWVSGKG